MYKFAFLNKQSLISIGNEGNSFKRTMENSISTYNIKMNILGSNGHIDVVKLGKIGQVRISECDFWLY